MVFFHLHETGVLFFMTVDETIKRAKEEMFNNLNLRDRKLKRFPVEIMVLTGLLELYLSGNQIKGLMKIRQIS